MSPLILLFAGVAFVNAQLYSDRPEVKNNLTLIATVDGKEYYVTHYKNRMNWFAGKDYCEERGMKLASITSKAQDAALRDVHDKMGFTLNAWTAGRDAQLASQFRWDTTGEQLLPDSDETTFNEPRQGIPPYQTCLWYFIAPRIDVGLKFFPCTRETSVMCEKYDV